MHRLLIIVALSSIVMAQSPINSQELEHKFQQVLRGETEQDFKLGLALGAGAAKGFAHIGALRAIEEAGLRVDMIAGSSMGSIIGGGYAAGLTLDELSDVALKTNWLDVLNLIDPVFPTRGFIDGRKITTFLDDLFGNRDIEDLNMPFAATTVDILNGKLYVIKAGKLSKAVRSSSSIPIVFNPMAEGEKILVDGGMMDPVPIDIVRSLGADYIIAVNVLDLSNSEKRRSSFNYLNGSDIENSKSTWRIPRGDQPWYTAGQPNLAEIAHETVILSMALIAANQIELQQPNLVVDVNTGLAAWNFLEAEIAMERGYIETKKILDQRRAP